MTGASQMSMTRLMRRVVSTLERALGSHRERYEPSNHYMRGPGPKCREKQRQSEAHE